MRLQKVSGDPKINKASQEATEGPQEPLGVKEG